MFNSLLLDPPVLPRTDQQIAKSTPRRGLLIRFQALLESLVEASRSRTEVNDATFYRFPPF